MARQFRATPATRKAVPLLIGIAGPPGAGKTYSALVIAEGIRAHRGGPVIMIDTERNRSLAYAPPAGVAADGVNHFDFMHVPFTPPFSSLDFLDAVMQQREHKPSCIIIDSLSDEHEGDGGLLDFHDKELDRMAGDDWAKRERVGQAAWIKPKARRLEMMNGLFQVMTPLICCYRAREKTKQIANDKGKQVPTNIGWTPIAPPEIVHNMSLFALLPVKSDGVPMWKGNTAYEDFSIKLPRQFGGLFPEGKAINQAMGKAMSIWALGDQKIERSDPKSQTAATGATQTAAARTASEPIAATERGSEATGGDTGQMQTDAKEGADGPQEPAAALNAAPDSGTKESATDVSTGSPEANSSQPQLSLDTDGGSDDGFPGDRPIDPLSPAAVREALEEAAVEEEVEQPINQALVGFAEGLAGAASWKDCIAALQVLSRTDWWPTAPYDEKEPCRAAMYHRLLDLRTRGEKADPALDMHAYRAFIAYETDHDTMLGVRAAAARSVEWGKLDTAAKKQLDAAWARRMEVLEKAAEFA